jgi:hypothetical protein
MEITSSCNINDNPATEEKQNLKLYFTGESATIKYRRNSNRYRDMLGKNEQNKPHLFLL